MRIKEFFASLFNLRNRKRIAAPAENMFIQEAGEGDENDITSIAYYKSCVRSNADDIKRYLRYVEEYTEKFNQVKKEFSVDSPEYNNARDEMYRWKVALDEAKGKKEFFRANTQKDIDYRNEIYSNFPDKLKETLSSNLDLRFHSTSISATKQIIQSKQITSTPDRYDGYIKNSDGIGEISASSREDIVRTIKHYSHLSDYSSALPAGCVFALFPKDKVDASNYKRSVISSVDFRKNPEQLFGIFTTPENIESVKKWMKEAELDSNLVYTYEEFLDVVKVKSDIEDRKSEFRQRIEQPTEWIEAESSFIVPDPDLYPDNDENEIV